MQRRGDSERGCHAAVAANGFDGLNEEEKE
jgi:hypothetical protein